MAPVTGDALGGYTGPRYTEVTITVRGPFLCIYILSQRAHAAVGSQSARSFLMHNSPACRDASLPVTPPARGHLQHRGGLLTEAHACLFGSEGKGDFHPRFHRGAATLAVLPQGWTWWPGTRGMAMG